MEFTIDQILLMQDTIIYVRRRTQELTISEIVSREIDPVLFILLLTTEQFPSNGLMVNCHVSMYRFIHTKRATAKYAQRSKFRKKAEPLGKGWMGGRVGRH